VNKPVLMAALLASALLAQAAFAADQPASPPSGAADQYTLSTREYAQGEIVGESYFGPFALDDKTEIIRICSARGGEGAAARIPVCYMLALNPTAQAKLKQSMEGRMHETLQGFDQPPLREVRFGGWRIYFYFPYADRVQFTIVRTPAGVPALAEGDWGGAFQGDVLNQLVVYQQAEPHEAEPEEE
jgi:hypothetical protein